MKNNWLRLALLLGAVVLCGLALPAMGQQDKEYAILIVGDEGTAEMLRQEKVLISEMAKKIRKQSPDQRLPIYSYHFNKERERAYCENKLNVLSEDLLFVGIVELANKVPLKVVFRVDRINNPGRAANDILARADEIVSAASEPVATPSATPSASPSPEPSVSPSASPAESDVETTTSGEGYRVQLGSFAQLKYAQEKVADTTRADLEAAIVETVGPDGDKLFKVLSPLMQERAQADELLQKFKDAGFEEAFLTRSEAR